MPVVKLIKTSSTANLIDYVGWATHEVSVDGELIVDVRDRAVYEAGQNCRPATAKLEFRDLREEHGQQNAVYKVPPKYEAVEADDATHVKVGKNWRRAKPGEQGTHQRARYLEAFDGEQPTHVQVRGKRHGSPKYREAEQGERATHVRHVDQGDGKFPDQWQRRHEGQHWIISYGLHEVNPDDPEACEKAFDSVVAMWEQDRPGMQAQFTAHNDAKGSKQACNEGESGKFHVHVAENAVVHTEMQVADPFRRGGRTFRPGMRAAGPLTDVELVRERSDRFLEARGHEFGLGKQVLPSRFSDEAKAVKRTAHDFHTRQRGLEDGTGAISHQDQAREAVEKALRALAQDPDAVDRMTPAERMDALAEAVRRESDDQVSLTLRRTKKGESKLRSVVVEGRAQPMTGKQLGERYSDAGLQHQLSRIATREFEPLARPGAGKPKPLARADDRELDLLQREADDLAGPHAIAQGWDEAHELNQRFDEQQARLAAEAEARDKRHAQLVEQATNNPDVQLAAKAVWTTERYGYGADTVELTTVDRAATQEKHGLSYEQSVTAQHSAIELARRAKEAQEREAEQQKPSKAQQQNADQKQGSQSGTEQKSDEDKPKKPVLKPHEARRLGTLTGAQLKDRELVAIVRREHAGGGAYVDFQLAADDPAAAGQPGLNLMVQHRQREDGGRVAQTWQQLSPRMYEQLKQAGGDNRTTLTASNGSEMTVYRVKADLQHGKLSGYAPAANSFERSSTPVTPKTVAQQRAHEASNRTEEREQQHREREQKKFDQMADSLAKDVERDDAADQPQESLPAHVQAFNREQQRRSRDSGRGR